MKQLTDHVYQEFENVYLINEVWLGYINVNLIEMYKCKLDSKKTIEDRLKIVNSAP